MHRVGGARAGGSRDRRGPPAGVRGRGVRACAHRQPVPGRPAADRPVARGGARRRPSRPTRAAQRAAGGPAVISSHDEETIVNRTPVAILGGQPTRTDPYPAWPVHDDRDVEAVTRVVRSGRWGGFPYPGPETERFAARFAALQGGGYAVSMVNGTITMEVALRAADIGWGDEV